MLRKPKLLVVVVLLTGLLAAAGCNYDFKQLLQSRQEESPLIKVEIHFANNDNLTTYVKSLGVEKDGEVYVGGASVNYMYDEKGRIIGSYNYTKVEYIKILK